MQGSGIGQNSEMKLKLIISKKMNLIGLKNEIFQLTKECPNDWALLQIFLGLCCEQINDKEQALKIYQECANCKDKEDLNQQAVRFATQRTEELSTGHTSKNNHPPTSTRIILPRFTQYQQSIKATKTSKTLTPIEISSLGKEILQTIKILSQEHYYPAKREIARVLMKQISTIIRECEVLKEKGFIYYGNKRDEDSCDLKILSKGNDYINELEQLAALHSNTVHPASKNASIKNLLN